ncbi:MAG: hypothetical protein V2L15_05300, partial [Desulfobacteraceae bacterium]|nr:hypothetical protein [Desulfobacteraceae bacterium]
RASRVPTAAINRARVASRSRGGGFLKAVFIAESTPLQRCHFLVTSFLNSFSRPVKPFSNAAAGYGRGGSVTAAFDVSGMMGKSGAPRPDAPVRNRQKQGRVC